MGDIVTGYLGYKAAGKAADAQEASAQSANNLQQSMFDTTNANLAPYRQAGAGATNQLMAMNGMNPDGTTAGAAPNYSLFTSQPGYGFGLQQGQQALSRQLAASGSGAGGAAMKAAINYGQGYADQGYSNFYNRLSSMASLGESAAAQTGQFSANAANQMGNNITGAGNAQAAGDIGQSNALINSYNNMQQNALQAAAMASGY